MRALQTAFPFFVSANETIFWVVTEADTNVAAMATNVASVDTDVASQTTNVAAVDTNTASATTLTVASKASVCHDIAFALTHTTFVTSSSFRVLKNPPSPSRGLRKNFAEMKG